MIKKVLLISFLFSTIYSQNISFNLIPEYKSIKPNSEFQILIKITIEDLWHIYYLNPGDSGLKTDIEFNLPEGVTLLQTKWSNPEIINDDEIINYGYSHSAYALSKFESSLKSILKTDDLIITAKINWLACKEGCVPGEGESSTKINISNTEILNQNFELQISKIRNDFPIEIEEVYNFSHTNGELKFFLPKNHFDVKSKSNVLFIPDFPGILDNSKKQLLESTESFYELTGVLDNYIQEIPDTISGLILINNSFRNSKGVKLKFHKFK